MEYPEHGTRVLSHEDERESWSFALRAPAPALRDLVKGYCLYDERRTTTTTHQHLPQPSVTFIVGLDGKLDVRDSLGEHCEINAGEGFIAGVNTAPAQTHSERSQRGMEIAVSPLGTHVLLGGMPMEDLLGRAIMRRPSTSSTDSSPSDCSIRPSRCPKDSHSRGSRSCAATAGCASRRSPTTSAGAADA